VEKFTQKLEKASVILDAKNKKDDSDSEEEKDKEGTIGEDSVDAN